MKYASPLLLITVLAAPAMLAQSNTSTTATKPKATPKQGAAKVSEKKSPEKKGIEQKSLSKKGPEKTTSAGSRGSSGAKTTTVARKNISTKASSSNTTAARKTRSTKRPAATAARYRQLAPTPERYQEIQQALAEKGYLKAEPNGVWDAESQDALRQFQTDKNLPPTGKLTAASLIDLGLGPKTAGGSNADPPALPAAKSPADPPAADAPAADPPTVPPSPTPEAASPPKPAN